FLVAVRSSRKLHGRWVEPPSSLPRYVAFVKRSGRVFSREPDKAKHASVLVCRIEDNALVGVFSISEVVRGVFASAYLGYYAFEPHAGSGYMAEGLELVLHLVFRVLRLHRIEANVQPANRDSLALVESAGFVREGYS